MGYLIIFSSVMVIAIVLMIIGISKGYDSLFSINLILASLAFIIVSALIITMSVNRSPVVYANMSTQYHNLSIQIENVDNIYENKDLIEQIYDYNYTVEKAKNESFMNKYLNNQYFKDLPYIEIDSWETK